MICPRRGAAVAEFAVIAPVLVSLVLGMIEVGRMIMVQQTLVSSAREACRLAVIPGTTQQDVIDRADQVLNAADIIHYTINMHPDPPSSAAEGSPVTITLGVSSDSVSWFPTPMYFAGKSLAGSCAMRREWQ
jgi:hypothetical protein